MKLIQLKEYSFRAVDNDALVLKQQGISSHSAECKAVHFSIFMGLWIEAQAIAWCHQTINHSLVYCLTITMMPHDVNRLQRVNTQVFIYKHNQVPQQQQHSGVGWGWGDQYEDVISLA